MYGWETETQTVTHRLVGPDGVQERRVVPVANFREDEGQEAAVSIQLGVHEILKVKQVCNDVHGCKEERKVRYEAMKLPNADDA